MRSKSILIGILVLNFFLLQKYFIQSTAVTGVTEEEQVRPKNRIIRCADYRDRKPNLRENRRYHVVVSTNKKNIGHTGLYTFQKDLDKIIEGLKFENITQVVEDRLSLPRHLVLAVLIVESGGNENKISSAGAFGLSQLMPVTAREFGLDIHDRDHRVLHIDCSGRILATGACQTRAGLSNLETALIRYYGTYDPGYLQKVEYYMRVLGDPNFRKDLEHKFNRVNKHLVINNKRVKRNQLTVYLEAHQKTNLYYDLEVYKNLPQLDQPRS